MKNVENILVMFTDGTVLQQLKDLLRGRDAEFDALEQAYAAAARQMGGLEELLAVRDRQMVCDLWFAGWQGLMRNLENFRSPMGYVMLKLDYPELLREHIMIRMPGHRAAQQKLDAMVGAMTPAQREQLEAVDEYYAYLETVGLKLAHYLGFSLGDRMLPMTEPGYVPDASATHAYRMELEKYLGFAIE